MLLSAVLINAIHSALENRVVALDSVGRDIVAQVLVFADRVSPRRDALLTASVPYAGNLSADIGVRERNESRSIPSTYFQSPMLGKYMILNRSS